MSTDNKFVRSLIENAKQGNNAAIEQLFQMNLGKIYAFALRLTANKSLAELITRDTFIEAWKKINLVRSDSSFLRWLNAITVYHTIEATRNRKTKNKVDHLELRELESNSELDSYILTLPDQERMIFVLNRVEGYSLDEISDLMGIKKDQVQTHLNIAIDKLAENIPSVRNESVMKEQLAKLKPEIQPFAQVRDGIFSYIMDEKIREQKEQEKIAAALAEKENKDNEQEDQELKKELEPEPIETKPKKEFKINPAFLKKILFVVAALIIVAAAYIIISLPSGGWEIVSLTGQPKLNDKILQKDDTFTPEGKIETDENSSATFLIPDVGRLLVDVSTSGERTTNENEIKLNEGQIKKYEGDASDILTVITPLAKFTELYKGGAFKLNAAEDGTCKLLVESGWMIVKIKEFESYVPKSFGCLIMRGKYAIPYPLDSTPQLISLLENFTGANDPSIGTIMSLMTKKESLSLWHIIQLVSTENRSIAFDRLNELVQVPTGVTKEGILALNKNMLLNWRQEIELKME